MRFRFTIRSVLAMVLFVAVLLFLLRMGALSRANVKGPAVRCWGGWENISTLLAVLSSGRSSSCPCGSRCS